MSICTTGDEITVGLQKGAVELPTDPKMPFICVGPGTGVAPARAVIEARVMSGAKGWIQCFRLKLMLISG
jgi:sulfite reductase alpha subunit-like flavoprotein